MVIMVAKRFTFTSVLKGLLKSVRGTERERGGGRGEIRVLEAAVISTSLRSENGAVNNVLCLPA